MPDDLDLSRPIEAPLRPGPADHVGRFRVDLASGRWTWEGRGPGPADGLDPLALLSSIDGHDESPRLSGTVAATYRTTGLGGPRVLLLIATPEPGPGGVTSVVGDLVDLGPDGAAAQVDLTERIEQLESALRTRPVIEQAKGMLMTTHHCAEEFAFRLLIGVSQALNRKLRDVAVEIVAAMSADRPLPAATARALAAELTRDGGPSRR